MKKMTQYVPALLLCFPLTACDTSQALEPTALASEMLAFGLEPMDEESSAQDESGAHLGRLRRVGRAAQLCDPGGLHGMSEVCGRPSLSSASYAWDDCELELPEEARADSAISSGSLEVNGTLSGNCESGDAVFTRTTTFETSLRIAEGVELSLDGEVIATQSQRVRGARVMHMDLVRTIRNDERGGSISIALSGDVEALSDTTDGTRTLNGLLTMEMNHPYRGQVNHTITLSDVVRERNGCEWPLSGSIVRAANGESHTLTFGPECGDANLDGDVVSMEELGSIGGGGRRGRSRSH